MSRPQIKRTIVTFLAKKPEDNHSNVDVSDTANAVDAQALSEVEKQLRELGEVIDEPSATTRHEKHPLILHEISSILDMRVWLNRYFPNRDSDVEKEHKIRLQIIGHATSGSIALGASWLPDESRWYQKPYYVFNSNPRSLLFLAPFAGCIHEVMLAGCYAGSWRSNGYEINGRTLLFTLAEMWKCKARGANDTVSAESFDRDGWYNPKGIKPVGWSWNGRQATTRVKKPPAPPCEPGGLPRPSSISAYGAEITDPASIDELCAYFNGELQEEHVPRLALPELELQLHYGPDRSASAMLFCGAQFLRVTDGADVSWYASMTGRMSALRHASAGLADLISLLISSKEELSAVPSGNGAPPAGPSPAGPSIRPGGAPEVHRANGAAPATPPPAG